MTEAMNQEPRDLPGSSGLSLRQDLTASSDLSASNTVLGNAAGRTTRGLSSAVSTENVGCSFVLAGGDDCAWQNGAQANKVEATKKLFMSSPSAYLCRYCSEAGQRAFSGRIPKKAPTDSHGSTRMKNSAL